MDSFLETLKNLGPGRLVMMMLTFFGLIIFFIFIAARSSAPSTVLLYGGLSVSDSTEIAAKLDAANIAYRLSEDGTSVSVPQRDVAKSRMLLAQEGLPHQGSMGYEIFDQKQSFGVTSFQQNINQLRALEGELARTIGTIGSVRNARVHLVLPQRELFSRDTQPATASVFLNVRSGALGSEQILAIQHLVAAAVPQLKSSRVAIIDQNGDLLAKGDEEDSPAANAANGEQLQQKYQQRAARSIEEIVGRIVGYGKVRATVTAKLNFDVVSRNSESYNPDGQVVRSTQTVSDQSTDASGAGGAVSTETNLPGLPNSSASGGGAGGGSSTNRTEEVTNFEISKTIENIVRASGEVEKQSVAVLVDGRYETDTSVQKPADAAEDWIAPKKYVPRTQEELTKITALVKSAIGYDESRGDTIEVVNMPFAEEEILAAPVDQNLIMGFQKSDILGIAETLALSLVAVLIILLVLRPLATHFANAASRAPSGGGGGEDLAMLGGGAGQPQLTGPGISGMIGQGGAQQPNELESMIDMSAVEGKVKASSVQKISELVTNHPNETVSVIRQWMSQEN